MSEEAKTSTESGGKGVEHTATGDARLVACHASLTTHHSPDLLALLLADKRSENTRRAYRKDLTDFFQSTYGQAPTPPLMKEFLAQGTDRIAFAIAAYKGDLIARSLSEATVNRRLAAVNSLLLFARRLGLTDADVSGLVRGEKVVPYRDTTGITPAQARKLLQQPDRATLKGRRDYALLLLLLENALRSAEVRQLTVEDFRPDERTLHILGKGRGTQKETVTINPHTVEAIQDYLAVSSHANDPQAALFQNLHPSGKGGGLTSDGLYKIIAEYAEKAGFERRISPHRLRHTAITTALAATAGDVVRVQHLSRHARVETVMRYNDNRSGHQAGVTALLGIAFETSVEPHLTREDVLLAEGENAEDGRADQEMYPVPSTQTTSPGG